VNDSTTKFLNDDDAEDDDNNLLQHLSPEVYLYICLIPVNLKRLLIALTLQRRMIDCGSE
jgi:hypothetical protein